MGEKSGGLWLIVIVVVLAGLLIFGMTQIFPGAMDIVKVKLLELVTEMNLIWDNIPFVSGGEDLETP